MTQLVPRQGPASSPDPLPWRIWEPFSPRFDHFSVHRHSGYEFFLHVRGGGFYQLDQHVFPLQPYQLLIIRPYQTHGPVSRHPLINFERLLVQVSEDTIAQLRCGTSSLQSLVEQSIQDAPVQVILTPQDYQQLSSLAALIPPYEEIRDPLSHMEALGYISALLSRICKANNSAREVAQGVARDLLMQQIHDHVLTHYMEDCSLDALSGRFSISKFHLSRRFSQTYGVGLHQYVMLCRMTCAQRLIRQGEPLMSVSYQCGFNDYSSFVRAFIRHTGMNPRTWRKQLLPEARGIG